MNYQFYNHMKEEKLMIRAEVFVELPVIAFMCIVVLEI